MMKLGNRLKEARMACRLSQADLANRLSVSQSAVAHWERAKNEPNLHQLKSLSGLLGVDEHWLAFGSAKKASIGVIALLEQNILKPPLPDNIQTVDLPPYANSEELLEAIIVTDSASYPEYRKGDIIYISRKSENLHALSEAGVECYIETDDGKHYLRRVVATSDPTIWTLVGYFSEPIANQRIRFARPISWVQRNTSLTVSSPIT